MFLVGIGLAPSLSMAILTKTSTNEVREIFWMHWLFIRGNQAISCGVDARGESEYTVSVMPLWESGEATSESFDRPADALRRHLDIARYLRSTGWLLADGGPVEVAA